MSDIEGGNSTVEGLAIGSFSNAIHLQSAGNDLVTGNFLGTDTTSENSVGNSLGVLIDNVAGNTIGGLTPAAPNVVSGNNEGIQINGSNATSNPIVGNYIGTDATGTNRSPNGMGLEFVNSSWGNTVGGAQAGAGNLVSGNNGDAIKIDGGSYANVIQGNLVGTDVTDSTALVNFGKGVDINGDDNTIGETTPGSGNVLSGNSSNGIVLVFGSATGNLMEGNSIGTNLVLQRRVSRPTSHTVAPLSMASGHFPLSRYSPVRPPQDLVEVPDPNVQ
jgi:titin